MATEGFWGDQAMAERVSREYGTLKQKIETWTTLRDDVGVIEAMMQETDDASSLEELGNQLKELEAKYNVLEVNTLFTGAYDGLNAIVSIHAGAGGVDAQDWAEMLLRMYLRFAENQHWKTSVLMESRGTEAGIKSVTVQISGERAFGHLKTEAGVHRLVRLSPFNADALRQTSFALVDVIPEIERDEDVDIKPGDVRIDTFMAGGHGGQSVNTTYSAVRIVHIPTGMTVQCQNERSQAQNKESAMKVLRGKLLQRTIEQQRQEIAGIRGEVVSAEWGSQIRSYVLHPYQLVKDHRTNYETSDTAKVLDGQVMPFIEERLRQVASEKSSGTA
ncbi:peptide chain release factor 2 [Candidatus Uhrbacteria bacterium RIFCSPLOWO2_01_FULL_53_9]|uniref:Peptide chain release factor 2 n=1 Tax=Candidatus Uhrbacteria bacterium RIFCSPLOWO2_01_FULL_53_9 TaxID=1802403 RepID=A0A1F7UWZ1_9BACT|nr:MAG: peptide chain release factor 2 [Candidatus Uhrbacteria bacterium RIFCSPLOWO2_01_FULL_53_9]